MLHLSRIAALFLGLALCLPVAGTAAHAAYPAKPIKLIVPYGAGGSSDMSARLIIKAAEKYLGTSVAVINITGGGSAIGTLEASKAKPDGYTLLWQHKSLITSYHTGGSSINWSDLTPVCNALLFNEVMHVHKKNSDINTLDKLVAKAKANPETLRFPVQFGTGSHFGALAVEKATGTKFHLISSGGDVDRLNEQLGGRAEVVFMSIPPTLPHIAAGTIIPIAVGAEERDPGLPDVPTFRELGLDIVTTFNLGLYGPKGLPDEVVAKWTEAVKKALEEPEVQAELAKQSLFPAFMPQKEFTEYLTKLDKELYELAKAGDLLPK